MQTKLN